MITNNSPIGIFDSGLGGISVLNECIRMLPQEHYLYYGDSAFGPYGSKDKQFVIDRCRTICDFFMEKEVKAIIIACNTATSVAVDVLRSHYTIPIIGMEPALKVAAHHKKNQNIVVMATALTLKEEKFSNLMKQYEHTNRIIKLPCPEFVSIIENDLPNRQQAVNQQINLYKDILAPYPIDSVVLGCTHFVFLKDEIQKYFLNTCLVDGNYGTAKHLKDLLSEQQQLATNNGNVSLYNSDDQKLALSKKLITLKP